MNFSSHVRRIRETLRTSLSSPKIEMLGELRDCVFAAKSFLDTSEFDFYIRQFEDVELEEFATTHYAMALVKRILSQKPTTTENTRQNVAYEISMACENILTYTVDDFCTMQTEFHWYYCIDEGFVFKESGMGEVETPTDKNVIGVSRVAKVSELPIDFWKNLI